jgi:hypothetical protein
VVLIGFVFSARAWQPGKNEKIMKKTEASKSRKAFPNDMRSEYHFDYRKARPNRFADRMGQTPLVVLVDSDIAEMVKAVTAPVR